MWSKNLYQAYEIISNRTWWVIKIKISIEIIDYAAGNHIENQNLPSFTQIREETSFNSLKHLNLQRFYIHFHR